MAITRGDIPKKITKTLAFTGCAEKFELKVSYHNFTAKQLAEHAASGDKNNAEMLMHMIADWDAGYPLSLEGIEALEEERPGTHQGLFDGFFLARQYALEKNS